MARTVSILWSRLAKYGLLFAKKLYDITNFMNYETPSLGKRLTLAELRPYQEECLHPSLPQGKYVRAL